MVVACIVQLNVKMPVLTTDGVKVIPPRGQAAGLTSSTHSASAWPVCTKQSNWMLSLSITEVH